MIEWNDDEPSHDLCVRWKGVYVDVVFSHDQTWSVYYDNNSVCRGINSKEDAKKEAERYLERNKL